MLIGAWMSRANLPVQLNWSNIFITVLGCRLANDDTVDWDSLLSRFQGQLALWKQRQLSFRGRALISNMLGLSIFWYQATIFDMPKLVIHEINKLLFPFVWGKKREWMARTSVTQPLAAGSLGVVDVAKKVSSLHAVWFRRYFTLDPHMWSVFFDHYVSSIFQCSLTELLARDTIPAHRIKKLPSFYASLLRVWVSIKGCKTNGIWVIPRPLGGEALPLSKITAKFSYSTLLQLVHVDHRSLAKFNDLNIPVQWPQVWSSLRLWRFVRSVQDTSWLSFHGILPTADRLVRFGMQVSPACFCGSPEDLLHLFTTCHFAQLIFDWFVVQLHRFHPARNSISVSEILFGFSVDSQLPVVFSALLGILRHHIWLARNAYRFEHVPPDATVTLRNAKSTFRFLVRMHKRHSPRERFNQDWLADGFIGSLTEEDWIRFTRDFIT